MQPFWDGLLIQHALDNEAWIKRDFLRRRDKRIESYKATGTRLALMQLRYEMGSPVSRVHYWDNYHEDVSEIRLNEVKPLWDSFSISRALNVARLWADDDASRAVSNALYRSVVMPGATIIEIASNIVKCSDAGLLKTL